LQPAQEHDLDEGAGVERRRGAVKTDIGDEFAALRYFIEPREIGALMQEAAPGERAQKVGLRTEITSHGKPLRKRIAPLQ
jgi:hypothetical protein